MQKTFCKKELRKTTTAKNQETKQQLVSSFPILVPWEQFKVRAVSSAFFLEHYKPSRFENFYWKFI